MRKFIEKRVRYYDDCESSEMWLVGFHDPTKEVTIDAVDPVFVASSEKANFERAGLKQFHQLVQQGVEEGEFGKRDELKFEEIIEVALDKEDERRAYSPPPMA